MGFSQKIKYSNDMLSIDAKTCFKYISKDSGATTIYYDLEGNKLFYSQMMPGLGGYLKIGFVKTNQTLTISYVFRKKIIENLLDAGVIKNCEINYDKIVDFISQYDEHKENNSTSTVIIKEEPRSGVNINIGR